MSDDITAFIPVGSYVGVRSFTSGTFVGKLVGGNGRMIAISDWRWIREWLGTGGSGSFYDLVQSDVVPHSRGPFREEVKVLTQADPMVITEAEYKRLALG